MSKSIQKQVDKFNRDCPVGTRMVYRSSPGALAVAVAVTEPAFILGGHTACTFVDGVRGCVALNSLTQTGK